MCKHTLDGHICADCYYEYHESKEDLRTGEGLGQPEEVDSEDDEDSCDEDDL